MIHKEDARTQSRRNNYIFMHEIQSTQALAWHGWLCSQASKAQYMRKNKKNIFTFSFAKKQKGSHYLQISLRTTAIIYYQINVLSKYMAAYNMQLYTRFSISIMFIIIIV
ncbi:hypothetical protein ACJX0J_021225, partial [Zea mays]